MSNELAIIILAAGQGSRMKSDLPKVLHEIGDKPLLEHVVCTAQSLGSKNITVVYGHGGHQVQEGLAHHDLGWVEQVQQLGTGHAVQQALPLIEDTQRVLILYGDVPLIRQSTLNRLIEGVDDQHLALLTAHLQDASGYGRIVRDDNGNVTSIVEQKDASEQELKIKEINTGILALQGNRLRDWLQRLNNNNAQQEYYLTDIIAMAVQDGVEIQTYHPGEISETEGINNKKQLAELERVYQLQQAELLMEQGVTLKDPNRFDLRGEVTVGKDVEIDVNVVLLGKISLGDRVVIGPNCIISDSAIGAGTQIHSHSVIEKSVIGIDCQLGPYARVRPDTELKDKSKIGNFVEVKKSVIGVNSKVNHLSYIGDTTMGDNVNIGAGTITCNYDGANKHQTIIEDNVFVGSDSQLVAPVLIGDGATVGAGSTVTHDVPAGQLTLSRAPQKTRKGWKRPTKNK